MISSWNILQFCSRHFGAILCHCLKIYLYNYFNCYCFSISIFFTKRWDSEWPELQEKATIGRCQPIQEAKNKWGQVRHVIIPIPFSSCSFNPFELSFFSWMKFIWVLVFIDHILLFSESQYSTPLPYFHIRFHFRLHFNQLF